MLVKDYGEILAIRNGITGVKAVEVQLFIRMQMINWKGG